MSASVIWHESGLGVIQGGKRPPSAEQKEQLERQEMDRIAVRLNAWMDARDARRRPRKEA